MAQVVSAKDETVRLFKNNFLESFTHVHWSIPLWLYVPVVLYFLYRAITNPLYAPLSLLGFFLAGLFTWTLFEYLLHRFLFHFEPKAPLGKRMIFLVHGIHHAYPSDSWRLVMPPILSIPLAFFLYWALNKMFSPYVFQAFFPGFGIGYLSYDMIHYSVHHLPMNGRIGLFLKRYHLRHHFQEENRGFGVSSPLWDYVLGTAFPLRK
jgi:sterol desaturase/sphingolipid hydroxylase (fatty acid hydroxylase superfamily)